MVLSDNKNFTITISDSEILDGDIFEIRYRTYYEGTDTHPKGSLPPNGTVLRNSANIGGRDVVTQITTSGYTSDKSGSLNSEARTIAGVEYPRNSTLDWSLKVSANQVALDALIQVTDTITGARQICEGTEPLEERLNASLRVFDRVNNRNVADPNVTLSVAQGTTDDEVIYTITPDDIADISRNYEYFITYTTCTTSGGQDEFGTKYGNTAVGNGVNKTTSVEMRAGSGGTGTGVAQGSFSLEKVASDASVDFPEDTVFTFRAEEFGPSSFDDQGNLLPGATATDQYNLSIKADGTPVSGLNSRGNGWKVRLTEPTLPSGTQFIWAPGQFRASEGVEVLDEGRTAMVTITPRSNVEVVLENTASLGSATVTRVIEGTGLGSLTGDEEFRVIASLQYPDGSLASENFPIRDNGTEILGNLPIGTVITFDESQPADTATIGWGTPVFSPSRLVAGEDSSANAVTLTNTVSVAEGTFGLKKVVEGTEANNANLPQEYVVTAEWDGGSKELTLPGDGTVVPFGENLEAGTVVKLSEAVHTDGNNLSWAAPAFTREGISIVDGETFFTVSRGNPELTVTNTVVETGTLQVLKTVEGAAADLVNDNAEFTVLAEWKLADEDDFRTKELTLKNDGIAVSLGEVLPVGTEVRFTETATAAIDGVAWDAVTWTGGDWLTVDGQTAVGIVSDDPADGRLVTLANEATFANRPVTIQKFVEGEAADLVSANSYVISVTVPETGDTQNFTISAGAPVSIGEYPVGTEIVFSEIQPENTDQVTWGEPVFTPNSRIVVGADVLSVNVELTNVANHTYGTFDITKEIDGPEANNANVPSVFDVLATWVDEDGIAKEKTLSVPANGSVEFGENLKNGTQVTLTEIVPADGNGIAWGVPVFSGDITIGDDANIVSIGKDQKKVTVTNFADTNTGTMRLIKSVGGEAADAVAEDTEFTVKATWNDGTEDQTRELTLIPGTATELGEDILVGTEITFEEIKRPEIAGVEWGSIAWGTNPAGDQWLRTNPDGTATGIISDDPTEGRLVTLTNEALWLPGSVTFEKYIFDGETPVPATEADLPAGAEFQVQIDSIELPVGKELPAEAGIAQGDIITLNAANNFLFESEKVLPKGTKVTFRELDPEALPGLDWGLPFYYVVADAGEAGDRNVVEIAPDAEAKVEIRNRPIPTSEVDIEKVVTGPKGNQITRDDAAYFQVTASWTDVDGFARECLINVVPGKSAVAAEPCDATVIDGKVQFPLNTDITFEETGAHTDVSNVKWSEVIWTINGGSAELNEVEGAETSTIVNLTGDAAAPVSLGLENKTSSNGMIIIPIPIPVFPGGGSSTTPNVPTDPVITDPVDATPGKPGAPEQLNNAIPDKTVATPQKGGGLAQTGANVAWIAGGAVLLLAAGAWLVARGRKNREA